MNVNQLKSNDKWMILLILHYYLGLIIFTCDMQGIQNVNLLKILFELRVLLLSLQVHVSVL